MLGLLILIGVGLLSFGLATVIKDSSDSPPPQPAPTMSPAGITNQAYQECSTEAIYWLDQIAAGLATTVDVAYEYGYQDPKTQIIQEAYLFYQQDAFQLGRERATANAINRINQDCQEEYGPP